MLNILIEWDGFLSTTFSINHSSIVKKQKTVARLIASLDWLTLLTPALFVCLTSQRNYAKCSSVYPEDVLNLSFWRLRRFSIRSFNTNPTTKIQFFTRVMAWIEIFELFNPLFYTKEANDVLEGYVKTVCLICITFPIGVKQIPALFTRHFPPNLHEKCLLEWRQM